MSLAEVEARAAVRLPGYVEAFKAAAKVDPSKPGHLLISQRELRELWARYTAPGLGDELGRLGGCCGE